MSRRNQLMIGAGSLLVALIALAAANLILLEPDEKPSIISFLVLGAICAATAAGIYLYLIPAAERAGGRKNRLSQAGFITSLVSVAFIIVYQTALPFVLGAGGAVLGALGQERGTRDLERAPRGEEQADEEVGKEGVEEKDEEEGPTVAERAGQAWAATVMGVLAFLACLVLFVIQPGRPG